MKPPVDTLSLFPVLNESLFSFLKQLSISDWNKPTIAKQWVVKDVVAHLVDGNFRRIALHRDQWKMEPASPINSYQDLVDYLNKLNADWVRAMKRVSPGILMELLEISNKEVYKVFQQSDPFGKAMYSVSWAGEDESYNWFDLAREYTERWLHQQQIRNTFSDNGIMTEELYHPLLNTFMQAWPYSCKNTNADEGTVLKTIITGTGGGEWLLTYNKGWKFTDSEKSVHAETIIDGEVAWKLFSKSLRKEDIPQHWTIKGNISLGEKVLDMISVMA
jgi:hypothetical protein